jgi:hypothetical protein
MEATPMKHHRYPKLHEPEVEIAAWRASALEGRTRNSIARELGVSWTAAQSCIWRGCLRLRPLGDDELCDALHITGGEMLARAKHVLGITAERFS